MPTDQTPAPNNPPDRRTAVLYGASGRIIATSDPPGVVTYIRFDPDGNVIEVPDPPAGPTDGPPEEPDNPHVVG